MNNTKKGIALIIGALLCVLEVVVVAFYFKTFNGGISIDNQDWATFSQILNGCVMALLTGINIGIFYKISEFIESNAKERAKISEENADKRADKSNEEAKTRAIKQTLFEAQLIITQMRVKHYEELSQLINEIKVDLFQGTPNKGRIEQLKKNFIKIDESFLFKNDNLEGKGLFFELSQKILTLLKQENINEKHIEDTVKTLTSFVYSMELHIIAQMLRDQDIVGYMNKHKGNLDSAFNCIDQFTQKLHENIAKNISLKQ